MQTNKKAKAVPERMKEVDEQLLAQLIDAVSQASHSCVKIKICHRALWDFASEACYSKLQGRHNLELIGILQTLCRYQEQLDKFLADATNYSGALEL
jgi:hypothetical protein